jgi:30S ribosomal protein S31
MEQIASACGSLAPGSLVLVDTEWPSELLRMGKGDQRTKRGKIYRGCYGKARPKRPKKNTVAKSQ